MIKAKFDRTFESWRNIARRFLASQVIPQMIIWNDENLDIFGATNEVPKSTHPSPPCTVPKKFMELAEAVAVSNDNSKWDLLYRILYRLRFENPNLLSIPVDPDIHRAELLNKSVRRDIHKMHAFVRFKRDIVDEQEVYRAWHKPEHPCLRLGAPFFARRFGDKPWSIFTPDESAHWDLTHLTFGPGMEQHQFQTRDDWDEIWKTYYKSIFNPARIKIKMMKQEMAPKYWSSMPETALINELVREAPARLQKMAQDHQKAADVDLSASLPELALKARDCRACPLFGHATQTIFGEGPNLAEIMIVGEQPGDLEDRAGRPFIGPAGEILDTALVTAGLNRKNVYVTNAIKHFKWTPSADGKTRLHKKASGPEMSACKPWLEAEITRVNPKVIVALGTTAGTAVLGRLPQIVTERGRVIEGHTLAPKIILSWHPSAILRSHSEQQSKERGHHLATDLRLAYLTLQNSPMNLKN